MRFRAAGQSMGPGPAVLGATPESFVALSVPNSVELVAAALATWKIGAVPIPMRWDLPDWEQERLLEVISPAFVLTEDNVAEQPRRRRR